MLTDAKLKAQVDSLWDKLWTGGLSNPMDAIEQLSYLLFLRRLEDADDRGARNASLRGEPYAPRVPAEMRWSRWTQLQAGEALATLKDKVFPWLKSLGQGSSFERYMTNAECKINKPGLLIEACKLIDQMHISSQNQDVQGDLYEYLLERLNIAGRNGQFRTPRHIIRMMVEMIAPRPGERIGDLAAGTCGFLVNAYQHVLETHTSPGILEYDAAGLPHNLVGDQLAPEQRQFLQTKGLRGYDNDSGMTMLRIGSMNLMLHGIDQPQFYYTDTLSKAFDQEREYDVILMNPPFKGAVDKDDVHPSLPANTTKSELLFVHLILRALDMGGRCAVIVPDGVLFGSSRAHVETRKKLLEHNRLDGVISMPGGVFKPYAGVSTAVLLLTRGATTERIWFYDMAHDGFSLDDKRLPVAENDIPDVLDCWRHRRDPAFQRQRDQRQRELRDQLAPLKAERLRLHGEINRLTFESVLEKPEDSDQSAAPGDGKLQTTTRQLVALQAHIAPLQAELDQLSRQFWVTLQQVRANRHDLSASRYRELETDDEYYESPGVTLERLLQLEKVSVDQIEELRGLAE
jgi:type I restriction enzyme M protein